MLTFSEYYQSKLVEELGLGDMDAFPADDELLIQVAMMAIRNHNDKIMEFFNMLAKHDENIRRMLGKYKDNRNSMDPKTNKQQNHDNQDVVSPNSADMQGPV